MRLKTAVDHQAYSLPQNQGLSNYQIDDELIAKIQQNYHYPYKNLEEFNHYLKAQKQQFYLLLIIDQIEEKSKK